MSIPNSSKISSRYTSSISISFQQVELFTIKFNNDIGQKLPLIIIITISINIRHSISLSSSTSAQEKRHFKVNLINNHY